MPLSLEGWSPLGIASAAAIVPGVVLLVMYAVRRGLVHRELDALDPDEPLDPVDQPSSSTPVAAPAATATRSVGRSDSSRVLGTAGALLLSVGLALGLLTALTSWGSGQTAGGPGVAPADCAQSWSGCPQATPRR